MSCTFHTTWKSIKDNLAKASADMKKTNGNAKPIDDALKSFTAGFGPTLDKMADAYKAKKDADVKKLATAALKIAGDYEKVIETIPYPCRSEAGRVRTVIKPGLEDLKTKGITSNVLR
jgi:hypothetical protein